jgi:hypothetical protein
MDFNKSKCSCEWTSKSKCSCEWTLNQNVIVLNGLLSQNVGVNGLYVKI